jgi:hypothetical protein
VGWTGGCRRARERRSASSAAAPFDDNTLARPGDPAKTTGGSEGGGFPPVRVRVGAPAALRVNRIGLTSTGAGSRGPRRGGMFCRRDKDAESGGYRSVRGCELDHYHPLFFLRGSPALPAPARSPPRPTRSRALLGPHNSAREQSTD